MKQAIYLIQVCAVCFAYCYINASRSRRQQAVNAKQNFSDGLRQQDLRGKMLQQSSICAVMSEHVVWPAYHVHDGEYVVLNMLVLVIFHHRRIDNNQCLHVAFHAHWAPMSTTPWRHIAFCRCIYITCISIVTHLILTSTTVYGRYTTWCSVTSTHLLLSYLD